jgi:hypothetical protein
VIDRLDRHQVTVVAKYDYGPEERERLLAKINRLADNLQPVDCETAAQGTEEHENIFSEIPS